MNTKKRRPTHPGAILKNLYILPLDLTITKLSEILGVSRKALSNIVNENKSITPLMALRLSKGFPNSTPDSWLNLQKNYDLWQAEKNTDVWRNVKPAASYISEDKNKYG